LTSLNISKNSIGRINIFPDGWRSKYRDGCAPFVHIDGRKTDAAPEGATSSGAFALADALRENGVLLSLDLSGNILPADVLASIVCVQKAHAIQQHRACICLVGHELMTRDLRAIFVASYYLNPRCWLPDIATENMLEEIVGWL
jgi:hypothetical protein